MLSRTLGTGEDDMLHKAWGEYRVCLTGFYCFYFSYCLLDEGAGEDTKCFLQVEDLHYRGSHYLHVLEYHSSRVFHCGDFLLFWDRVLASGVIVRQTDLCVTVRLSRNLVQGFN